MDEGYVYHSMPLIVDRQSPCCCAQELSCIENHVYQAHRMIRFETRPRENVGRPLNDRVGHRCYVNRLFLSLKMTFRHTTLFCHRYCFIHRHLILIFF